MKTAKVTFNLASTNHARALLASLNMSVVAFQCQSEPGYIERLGIVFDGGSNARGEVFCAMSSELLESGRSWSQNIRRKPFIQRTSFAFEMPIGMSRSPHSSKEMTVEEELQWVERSLHRMMKVLGEGLFTSSSYEIDYGGIKAENKLKKAAPGEFEKLMLDLTKDKKKDVLTSAIERLSSMERQDLEEKIELFIDRDPYVISKREFLTVASTHLLSKSHLARNIEEERRVQALNKVLEAVWQEAELPNNEYVCRTLAKYIVNSRSKKLWRMFARMPEMALAIDHNRHSLFNKYDICEIYEVIGDKWMEVCPESADRLELQAALNYARIMEASQAETQTIKRKRELA